MPTTEHPLEDKYGKPGTSPDAAERKAARASTSSDNMMGASASQALSTSNSVNTTHSRQGTLFSGSSAPAPPPAKSRSTANGSVEPTSLFNYNAPMQIPPGSGLFGSRPTPNNVPESSGTRGLFGSSSKSTSSDAVSFSVPR